MTLTEFAPSHGAQTGCEGLPSSPKKKKLGNFTSSNFFGETSLSLFLLSLPSRWENDVPATSPAAVATALMSKQVPANERKPTQDVSSVSGGAVGLQSPSVPTGKVISEWDRWVMQQKKLAEYTSRIEVVEEGDVPKYTIKRRPKSARTPKSARSEKERTAARLKAMDDAKAKNDEEVEELKQLLGRTLYTAKAENYIRAGNVATAGLRKLNDGQADSIADLRRRRVAEDEEALAIKGDGPAWDSTPMHYCPPALKGCQPITPEPWARDQLAYEQGMEGHGATKSTATNYKITGSVQKKHVSMIANDMDKYRKELGGGKMGTPNSARVNRAWNDTTTPRTGRNTGRYSTRRTARTGRSASPEPEPEPSRIVLTERQMVLRARLMPITPGATATGA